MRREGRTQIFPLKTSAGEGWWRSKHFCFGVKTGNENWGETHLGLTEFRSVCFQHTAALMVLATMFPTTDSEWPPPPPPPAGYPESELSSRHPQVFPGTRRSPVSLVEGVNACQEHQNSQSKP